MFKALRVSFKEPERSEIHLEPEVAPPRLDQRKVKVQPDPDISGDTDLNVSFLDEPFN